MRSHVPWAAALAPERDARLRELAALFLHRKLVGSFLMLAHIGARVDARRLVLRWPRGTNGDGSRMIAAIERALRPNRGGRCAVAIRYAGESASAQVLLGA